jgi:hypothetical protein
VFSFSFGFLEDCVGASEGYSDVCLFEEFGNFPDSWGVVCKTGPFAVVLVVFGSCFVVHFHP